MFHTSLLSLIQLSCFKLPKLETFLPRSSSRNRIWEHKWTDSMTEWPQKAKKNLPSLGIVPRGHIAQTGGENSLPKPDQGLENARLNIFACTLCFPSLSLDRVSDLGRFSFLLSQHFFCVMNVDISFHNDLRERWPSAPFFSTSIGRNSQI